MSCPSQPLCFIILIISAEKYKLWRSCYVILYSIFKQEVLGRTNSLLSFDTTRTACKTTPPTILRCSRNALTELFPSNNKGIYRQIHRHTSPTFLLLLCVLVAAGTCLPSRCLATKGGTHIKIHRLMGRICEVHRWDGLRCHDIHTKFHNNWLIWRDSQAHRQHRDRISLFSFFNKESRPIRN
jgi:hypothetical protein